MVSVGTKVVFSVNATPISDPISTFIGFNYVVADGNSYTVGVNGGTDIKYETFSHNNQYTNDSNVGTYTYSILGEGIREISVLTIQSFKVDIDTSNLNGKITLTSQHGFNKVIDASTEDVTLYAGEWIITSELTLAEIQEVFKTLTVVERDGKMILNVRYVG